MKCDDICSSCCSKFSWACKISIGRVTIVLPSVCSADSMVTMLFIKTAIFVASPFCFASKDNLLCKEKRAKNVSQLESACGKFSEWWQGGELGLLI